MLISDFHIQNTCLEKENSPITRGKLEYNELYWVILILTNIVHTAFNHLMLIWCHKCKSKDMPLRSNFHKWNGCSSAKINYIFTLTVSPSREMANTAILLICFHNFVIVITDIVACVNIILNLASLSRTILWQESNFFKYTHWIGFRYIFFDIVDLPYKVCHIQIIEHTFHKKNIIMNVCIKRFKIEGSHSVVISKLEMIYVCSTNERSFENYVRAV